MEDYRTYLKMSSHELAADESFQAFVFRKNEADVLFWKRFVLQHPSKRNDVDQAAYILSLLSFNIRIIPRKLKELEMRRLLDTASVSALQNYAAAGRRVVMAPPIFAALYRRHRFGIAASLVLLLCFFLIPTVFPDPFMGEDMVVLRTQYGENATRVLPDSTVVILNGNTRLRHKSDWGSKTTREVWLEGEAFFEVKHRGDSPVDRFTVHTPGMDVEVLGTEFNVFNRDHKTSVVLNSGQVRVNISADRDTTSILMRPDEALDYSRRDHSVARRQVNAEALTSWRRKVLVFEDTPLYEISEMIGHTYGLRMVFSSNVNKNEKLAGTVPTESLDVLLSVLAKSSNLKIVRNDDEIFIEKNVRPFEEP